MATRTVPFDEFNGVQEVLYRTVKKIVKCSTYKIARFNFRTKGGEPIEYTASENTNKYIAAVEENITDWHYHSNARNKYHVGPYYNQLSDSVVDPYIAVIQECSKRTNPKTAMDMLVEGLPDQNFLIDARAMAAIFTTEAPYNRKIAQFFEDIQLTAAAICASHQYSNNYVQGDIVRSLPTWLKDDVNVLNIQARINAVQGMLKLCDKTRGKQNNTGSFESNIMGQFDYSKLAYVEKVRDLSHRLIPSILLRNKSDKMIDELYNVSNNPIKWDLTAAAYLAKRGIGYGDSLKVAYLGLLEQMYEGEDYMDFETEAEMSSAVQGFLEELTESLSVEKFLRAGFFGNYGIVICSKDGALINYGQINKMAIMSRTELKLSIEILKETLATYICCAIEDTRSAASNFYDSWIIYHQTLINLKDVDASRAAVVQRDLDLLYKNRAINDISRVDITHSKIYNNARTDEGPTAEPIIAALEGKLNNDDMTSYGYVRMLRCIVPTWYNPVSFANETIRCYHLDAVGEQDSIDELIVELKMIFAKSHKSRTGEFPEFILNEINKLPFEDAMMCIRNNYVPREIAARWEPTGEGKDLFDWDAVRIRDKTNVAQEVINARTALDLTTRSVNSTREILYFKGEKAPEIAQKYVRILNKAEHQLHPVLTVKKPEQKHDSRNVIMEESLRRKLNTVLNNNAIAIADVHEGSLLKASSKKLENVENFNTKALGDNERNLLFGAIMNYFIGVDFTKFGHYIAYNMITCVAVLFDKYYGVDVYFKLISGLKSQVIVSCNNGFFIKFQNVQGADGQGLRNGIWQTMLAAAGNMVFTQLRKECRSIQETKSLFVSFFMDDNNFCIPLIIPKINKEHNAAWRKQWISTTTNKMRDVISETYNKIGLDVQVSKLIISRDAYAQTGDIYKYTGKCHIITKGVQSLFTEPSIRAPSLLDCISNARTTAEGMLANRCPIHIPYVMSLIGAAYQFYNYGIKTRDCNPTRVGVAISLPIFIGGLGLPSITNYLGSRGVYKYDDVILSAHRHIDECTVLAPYIQPFFNLRKRDFDIYTWCKDPLYAPRANIPKLSNALSEKLLDVFANDKHYDLDNLRLSMRHLCKYVCDCYSDLPTTVLPAIIMNHPYQAVSTEVEMFAESSTAQSVLPEGDIRDARNINWRRAFDYSVWLTRLGFNNNSNNNKVTKARLLSNVSWSNDALTLHGIGRSMFFDLVEPTFYGPIAGDPMIHVVKRDNKNGVSLLDQAKGVISYVDTENKFMTPAFACIKNSVDISEALRITQTGDNSIMFRTMEMIWSIPKMSNFITCKLSHNPYISIPCISYVPPVNAQAIAELTSRQSVISTELDKCIKYDYEKTRDHINYMQLSACAHVVSQYVNTNDFFVSSAIMWTDPLVKTRDQQIDGFVHAVKLPTYFNNITQKIFKRAAVIVHRPLITRKEIQKETDDARAEMTRIFDGMLRFAMEEQIRPKTNAPIDERSVLISDHDNEPIALKIKYELERFKKYKDSIFHAVYSVLASIVYVSSLHVNHKSIIMLLCGTLNDIDSDEYEDTLTGIIPTPKLCQSVYNSIESLECKGLFVNSLDEMVRRSTYGTGLKDPGSTPELMSRYCIMNNKFWFKMLKTKITAIPLIPTIPNTKVALKTFYLTWANHYNVKYNINRTVIKQAKLQSVSNVQLYIHCSEWLVKPYEDIIYYHCAWYGYMYLSSTDYLSQSNEYVVLVFAYNLLMPLSKLAIKYDFKRGSVNSAMSLWRILRNKGYYNLSKAIENVLERLEKLFVLVKRDLGIDPAKVSYYPQLNFYERTRKLCEFSLPKKPNKGFRIIPDTMSDVSLETLNTAVHSIAGGFAFNQNRIASETWRRTNYADTIKPLKPNVESARLKAINEIIKSDKVFIYVHSVTYKQYKVTKRLRDEYLHDSLLEPSTQKYRGIQVSEDYGSTYTDNKAPLIDNIIEAHASKVRKRYDQIIKLNTNIDVDDKISLENELLKRIKNEREERRIEEMRVCEVQEYIIDSKIDDISDCLEYMTDDLSEYFVIKKDTNNNIKVSYKRYRQMSSEDYMILYSQVTEILDSFKTGHCSTDTLNNYIKIMDSLRDLKLNNDNRYEKTFLATKINDNPIVQTGNKNVSQIISISGREILQSKKAMKGVAKEDINRLLIEPIDLVKREKTIVQDNRNDKKISASLKTDEVVVTEDTKIVANVLRNVPKKPIRTVKSFGKVVKQTEINNTGEQVNVLKGYLSD